MPKQAEDKRDGVINQQNNNFKNFLTWKILILSKRDMNQLKSTVQLGYMCPRGLTGPPAVTLTK